MLLNIDTATIRRLRDALVAQTGGDPADTGREQGPLRNEALIARVAPFVETMYLVALADGERSPEELASVRGAVSLLSSGMLDANALQTLLAQCDAAVEEHGVEVVLQMLGSRLCADRADRETAFTLAAATALADERVDSAEAGLLQEIAEWFGISSRRARELAGELGGS